MSITPLLLTVVDTLSILFMGDVMQHSRQLQSAHIPGTDTLVASSYDYSSYFTHIRPYIDSADLTVANMEFCLGGPPYTGYPSFSAPESIAEEAAEAGIGLFLCANNHICDRGRRGLTSSFEKYSEIGVPITGIYRDSLSWMNDNPLITVIKGIKIAFVNFTYGTNGVRVPAPYIVNMMDRHSVREAIERAREAEADIILAAMGQPNFVKAEMVKEGAVVIDVGTTRVPDASKKSGFKLTGGVKFDEVAPKCSFITPVPGGVGPMTIVSLMKNTLLAGKKAVYND